MRIVGREFCEPIAFRLTWSSTADGDLMVIVSGTAAAALLIVSGSMAEMASE